MKRKDCAYCIDLDEQGALCDHPLHLDCGEPVEARCSSRCVDYEQRMSITEALSRIHDLEAKLAESEKYRAGYADILIPLKAENAKLREFVRAVAEDVYGRGLFDCGECRFFDGCYNGEKKEHAGRGCQWWLWARELGIEGDHE